MKFNFRKIASVITSAVMLSSTIGIAAAASYPAPFVKGGAADVAVVVGGSDAANSDLLAATDVGVSLQVELAKQTATSGTTTTGSVSGEAAALFTGGSKLYVNDTLNTVKSVLTKTDMPTVLADGTFSGNVDATYTQTIDIGSNPRLLYGKRPTSDVDPAYAYQFDSSASNYIYSEAVSFSKAVNVTHADSKNQDLTLFGQKYTISAATDSTALVLLKESTRLNFDSGGVTSQEVTVAGKKYTVEMVSASTTTAIIKVTDENGNSEQKEITEGLSKKVNGVTIAVNTADSNNLKFTASIVAGAEKITLKTAGTVTYGENDKIINGVTATLSGGTPALTKITVNVAAVDDDHDAIKPGESFVDPVFGTFRLEFAGLNIPDNSSAREDIKIRNSGDAKMSLEMIDMNGVTKSITWATNISSSGETIIGDASTDGSGRHVIHVAEMEAANVSDYIIVGNEDDGRLVKVTAISNDSSSYLSDSVTFEDVFAETTYTTTIIGSGAGSVVIGGKTYEVSFAAAKAQSSSSARQLRLNYSDSTGNNMIVYPTIATSKGAKIALYKPMTINLTNWNGAGQVNASGIMVPNGADTYQTYAVVLNNKGNFTIGGTALNWSTDGSDQVRTTQKALTSTGFSYNFTCNNPNEVVVNLVNPETGGNVVDPAIMIFEEKDDNNRYEGMIVTLEEGNSADDGIGISDVVRTYQADSSGYEATMASDSKKSKEADIWGVIVTTDSSDSDQSTTTISYPNEQLYAEVYIAQTGSSVTPGTTSSGSVSELGSVTVEDSDISSVKDKNLIVVGGSCINSVAAKMLGSDSAICGAAFTTKTGVGADQFLIESMASPYNAAKIAVLVAGYEAADTTKAVTYLTKVKPVTDAGKKYKGTSATSAELVTTTA